MSARVTNAQVMEALVAISARLDAIESTPAGNTPAKAEAPAPKVPFLSCWNASRVNAGAKGVFLHKPKNGEPKKYRALTREEAHAMLDANLDAGRLYAIPA